MALLLPEPPEVGRFLLDVGSRRQHRLGPCAHRVLVEAVSDDVGRVGEDSLGDQLAGLLGLHPVVADDPPREPLLARLVAAALEQVRRAFPGVQVAAVAVRGDRSDLRRMIAAHGWGFPVGYDRDGAVANLYGVAVCPQITYAYPGGEVRGTAIGEQTAAELRESLQRLVAGAKERGWQAPSRG